MKIQTKTVHIKCFSCLDSNEALHSQGQQSQTYAVGHCHCRGKQRRIQVCTVMYWRGSLTCSGHGKAKRLAGSRVEPPLYWHHYRSSISTSPVGGKEVSDYVHWRVQITSCVSWILNRALLSKLFMMSQIMLVCLPVEIPFLMRSLLRKFKLSAINVKTAR